MINELSLQPYLEQALSEHREVHRAVVSLKSRLQKDAVDVDAVEYIAVIQALQLLRSIIEGHFEREAAGGYFDEAVSRAPHVATKVARLQRQHAQFIALADRLINRACRAQDWQTSWEDLRCDFGRFTHRLEKHEEAENRILGQAFNVAIA